MRIRRTFAIISSLLMLGAGAVARAQQNPAQEKNQVEERNRVRNGTQEEANTPLRNRLMFRDENGDGICDSFRDHDNDGIPNGQDPDWTRGKNGMGNQSRSGNKNYDSQNGIRNGQGSRNTWSNRSLRQSRVGGGKGFCGKDGQRGNSGKGGKQ